MGERSRFGARLGTRRGLPLSGFFQRDGYILVTYRCVYRTGGEEEQTGKLA